MIIKIIYILISVVFNFFSVTDTKSNYDDLSSLSQTDSVQIINEALKVAISYKILPEYYECQEGYGNDTLYLVAENIDGSYLLGYKHYKYVSKVLDNNSPSHDCYVTIEFRREKNNIEVTVHHYTFEYRVSTLSLKFYRTQGIKDFWAYRISHHPREW